MSASIPQSTELGKRPRITADHADRSKPGRGVHDSKALRSLDPTEGKRQRIETGEVRLPTAEASGSSTAMPTAEPSQKGETTSDRKTKEAVLKMLGMLVEEFNCNHQADLTGEDSS